MKLWLEKHSLPQRTDEYLTSDSLHADTLVRKSLAGQDVRFVSPIDALCDAQGCLLSIDGKSWAPLTLDASHLTPAGSEYLLGRTAPQIFDQEAPRKPPPLTFGAPASAVRLH